MDLDILRRSAAEIAALAVYDLYPNVELIQARISATGFEVEFSFPHPLHPHLIEERMRRIVQERRPIRLLEMVPFSAYELLRSQGRARLLPDEPLVQVIQIGDYYNYSPGRHVKNTAELSAFKIKAELLGEGRMRITGWCHQSKGDLKSFLKRLESYREPRHVGEMMGYWKGDVWYAPGIRVREKLIQFLKEEWFDGGLEIEGPSQADPFVQHRLHQSRKVVERNGGEIRVSFFGSTAEEKISSLHLIAKTLTILGFDRSIFSTGFMVEDGIGRSHRLVVVDSRGGDFQVRADVRLILEQMLEKNLMGVLENK
ncbi:MAG: hypothetical protein KGQ49_06150 [Verrucomicrobia bacterium]|nr:hypothetical protein [Verrucomicrobiota bacterium]MBU6446961.1 hypothetical protein [Verrucomicrobiota bacterium]MDE3047298.1 hypothetical protein [Verrucomicrobiota bacterium]